MKYWVQGWITSGCDYVICSIGETFVKRIVSEASKAACEFRKTAILYTVTSQIYQPNDFVVFSSVYLNFHMTVYLFSNREEQSDCVDSECFPSDVLLMLTRSACFSNPKMSDSAQHAKCILPLLRQTYLHDDTFLTSQFNFQPLYESSGLLL